MCVCACHTLAASQCVPEAELSVLGRDLGGEGESERGVEGGRRVREVERERERERERNGAALSNMSIERPL